MPTLFLTSISGLKARVLPAWAEHNKTIKHKTPGRTVLCRNQAKRTKVRKAKDPRCRAACRATARSSSRRKRAKLTNKKSLRTSRKSRLRTSLRTFSTSRARSRPTRSRTRFLSIRRSSRHSGPLKRAKTPSPSLRSMATRPQLNS